MMLARLRTGMVVAQYGKYAMILKCLTSVDLSDGFQENIPARTVWQGGLGQVIIVGTTYSLIIMLTKKSGILYYQCYI
jgi:hypothetical protein